MEIDEFLEVDGRVVCEAHLRAAALQRQRLQFGQREVPLRRELRCLSTLDLQPVTEMKASTRFSQHVQHLSAHPRIFRFFLLHSSHI